MKRSVRIEGRTEVSGTPAEVFVHLLDPRVLREALPDCESLVRRGADRYEVVLDLGIGLFKSRLHGLVRIESAVPGEGYRMSIEARGRMGHLSARAEVRLAAVGSGTEVSYQGDAEVGGGAAFLGRRSLEREASAMLQGFFDRLPRAAGG